MCARRESRIVYCSFSPWGEKRLAEVRCHHLSSIARYWLTEGEGRVAKYRALIEVDRERLPAGCGRSTNMPSRPLRRSAEGTSDGRADLW